MATIMTITRGMITITRVTKITAIPVDHGHGHDHHHSHVHRNVHDIYQIIDRLEDEEARRLAKEMFRLVAEAESQSPTGFRWIRCIFMK